MMLMILSVQAQGDTSPEPPPPESPTLIAPPTEASTDLPTSTIPTDVPTEIPPSQLPTQTPTDASTPTPGETATSSPSLTVETATNTLQAVEETAVVTREGSSGGEETGPIDAHTIQIEALQAPGNAQIALDGTTVQLTWDDTNSTESYYEVEHGWDASFYPIFSAGPNSTTWSETRTVCGATYWYRVRAVRTDTYQNGPWSEWLSVTTPPCVPTCPTGALPQRVSVGSMGQYQTSGVRSEFYYRNTMSTDGRYVLFASTDPLTDDYATEVSAESIGEYPRVSDLYRYDRQTCTTVKVTMGDNESETVNAVHREMGVMTDDGSKVFFVTDEPGLVNETYSGKFLFMRDIAAGTTTRYPLTADSLWLVDSTLNGRYVLFGTFAAIGSLPDNNNGSGDVYVYDTQMNVLTPVSVNAVGTAMASGDSGPHFIFNEGGTVYVLFSSNAGNIVAGDTNQRSDIFLRNLSTGVSTLLSTNEWGGQFTNTSTLEGFAARDGTLSIIFRVDEMYIDPLYQRITPLNDLTQGYTRVAARATGIDGAVANADVYEAGLSQDGRWLFFMSNATNLGTPDHGFDTLIYVRDLFTYTTSHILLTTQSPRAMYLSNGAYIDFSPDGSTILYHSRQDVLSPGDTNTLCEFDLVDSDPNAHGYQYDYDENCEDIYTMPNPFFTTVPAPATPTITPSPAPTVTPSNPVGSHTPAATLEATLEVTLEPTLEATMPSPTATQSALTQTAVAACNSDAALAVRTIAQLGQPFPYSFPGGKLSYDGRYVFFTSKLPQTGPENESVTDVYRYDTQTCAYFKVSVSDTEQETAFAAYTGPISPNGDQAVFMTTGIGQTNEGTYNKGYVRTISTGQTQRISPAYATPPDSYQFVPVASISDDGRYVLSRVSNITTFVPGINDTNNSTTDPDDLLLYDRVNQTYHAINLDLTGTHTIISNTDSGEAGKILTNGGKVYVVYGAYEPSTPPALQRSLYVYNVTDGIIARVSLMDDESPLVGSAQLNDATIANGNLYVLNRIISPSAQTMYVRVVPLDNLGVGTTALVAPMDIGYLVGANISDNGRWVIWTSSTANLVPNDTNGYADVFVRDMLTNEVRRVSAAANGAQLSVSSYPQDISGDGRYILVMVGSELILYDNPLYVVTPPPPTYTASLTPWPATGTHQAGQTQTDAAPSPSLTPSATNSPLAAPVLVSPADGGTTPSNPELKWLAVAGTNIYEVQADDEPSFTTPIDSLSTTGLRAQFYTTSNQGQYWWRVRARNGNIYSPWSGPYRVIVNYALSPAHDSLAIPGVSGVTFRWTDLLQSSTQYSVEVANNPAFSSVVYRSNYISQATTTLTIPPGVYYWRVIVSTPQSNPMPFRNIATVFNRFTVAEAVPPALKPVTPTNGAFVPADQRPVMLAWGWAAVPLSISPSMTYEVELDTTANFNSSSLVSRPNLTDMMVAAPDLPDGIYYWHVRAINGNGIPGPWSTLFRFIIDTGLPTAPSLLTPADNITLTTSRPAFTWSKVSDAVSYSLEIADVCGGTAAYRINNLTTLAHTIPASASALKEGTYQVCVIAYDKSGNSSGYSAPRTFTLDRVTAPANGMMIPGTQRPIFRWTPALGKPGEIVSYKILIDSDTNFASPYTYTSPALAAPSAAHTGPLLPVGTYYWKLIRTVNGVDEVSPYWRSLIVGALTAGPVLSAPPLNQIVTGPTLLDWNDAVGPLGTTINGYEVVVSRAATFSPTIVRVVVENETSYTFTPLANQNRLTHYWRVRGLWNGVPVTNWSNRAFIVDNAAPAAPVITVPAANALMDTVRPLIRWTAVSTANSYTIQITDAITNSELVPPTPVTGLAYVPSINLPQTSIIIRVRANDGYNSSPWTSVTAALRLGNTPAQNARVLTGRPTFAWAAVPEATGYTLEIDNDPFFDATNLGEDGAIFRTITLGKVTSHTLTSGQALIDPGLYYWRVKPSNGDFPAATVSRSFAWLPATALKPIGLLTTPDLNGTVPVGVFNGDMTSVVFKWDDIPTMPLHYQLQVSTGNTFPSLGTVQYSSNTPLLPVDMIEFTEGLKYWRVRGIYSTDGTSFGAWSDVKSFTIDRIAPQPPVLTPMIGTTSSVRPVFRWFAQLQATQYLLSTSSSIGSVSPVLVNATSYTSPTALNQNNTEGYDWTVQSGDAAGNFSDPGLEATLYIFSGISPTRGQLLTTLRPTFTWAGVTGAGAATWILEVATDAAMSQRVYQSAALPATATAFTLPANTLTPGVYFWRVYRTVEDTMTIEGQPFYAGSLASITPRLVSPAPAAWINAEQVVLGAPFSWDAKLIGSPAINTAPLGYHFQMARASTFAANTIVFFTPDVTGTTFNFPTPPLVDGTYYWRIRARYEGDLLGPYSAPSSVRIDQTFPTTPALLAPVTGAVLTTHTPTLTWAASAGATQYVIEVATDDAFITLYRTQAVSSLTRSLTLSSLPNGVYYWRVIAKDAANNTVTSTARRLSIIAP